MSGTAETGTSSAKSGPTCPAFAESRGYTIELPAFRPTRDYSETYNLAGIPRMNDSITIALVTYLPKEVLPPLERARLEVPVPTEHEVECALVDLRTGRTIAQLAAQ
jgi:hypothetical protein